MITRSQFSKTIGKTVHPSTPGYRERLLEPRGKRPPVTKRTSKSNVKYVR